MSDGYSDARRGTYFNKEKKTVDELTNKEFLQWLHDRLVYVYGENRNTDFVQRLRTVKDEV